jgi:hypothetical protein
MKKIYFTIISVLLTFFGCAVSPQSGNQNSAARPAPQPVRVSLPQTDAAEPALAVDVEGNIYSAYVEHAPDKSADVYLQKFDSALKADGERVRINPEAGKATAWRGDPPTVQTAPGGMVFVGWTTKVESAEGPANDLFLSTSHDGGKTFDAPVKVNDDTQPRGHGMHALAVENDSVYFAWLDERYLNGKPAPKPAEHKPAPAGPGDQKMHHPEPNREIYFAVSRDGGKTFSENKKLAGEVCPCCKVGMAVADNRVYISWRQVLPGDLRHIAVAASMDGGAIFGTPVIVSDDKWQIGACPVSGAALAIANDGILKTIWYTAGEAGPAGLYYAESKDRGKTFSARQHISEEMIMGTSVLLSDDKNSQIALWAASGKIRAKKVETGDGQSPSREIAAGELPAAVVVKNQIVTAYIKSEEVKRGIWLNSVGN